MSCLLQADKASWTDNLRSEEDFTSDVAIASSKVAAFTEADWHARFRVRCLPCIDISTSHRSKVACSASD